MKAANFVSSTGYDAVSNNVVLNVWEWQSQRTPSPVYTKEEEEGGVGEDIACAKQRGKETMI